jgi:hypothetical protein
MDTVVVGTSSLSVPSGRELTFIAPGTLENLSVCTVEHICNPRTPVTEAGGSQIQDQPGYIVRPCLKIKQNKTPKYVSASPPFHEETAAHWRCFYLVPYIFILVMPDLGCQLD